MPQSTSSDRAIKEARRLSMVASVALTTVTVAAAVGAIIGVAIALLGEGRAEKLTGLAIAVGSALTWLLSALPCLAAQVFARYVERRVDADA